MEVSASAAFLLNKKPFKHPDKYAKIILLRNKTVLA